MYHVAPRTASYKARREKGADRWTRSNWFNSGRLSALPIPPRIWYLNVISLWWLRNLHIPIHQELSRHLIAGSVMALVDLQDQDEAYFIGICSDNQKAQNYSRLTTRALMVYIHNMFSNLFDLFCNCLLSGCKTSWIYLVMDIILLPRPNVSHYCQYLLDKAWILTISKSSPAPSNMLL